MKTIKITYYVTTAIIALMMTYSAYAYLTQDAMKQAFHHLGYPDYFRIELAVIKILGVIALLAPIQGRIKEWAYAGFTITFVSAFIAHTSAGDPGSIAAAPAIFFVLLAVSYITYHKWQKTQNHKK
ncbi:DoxX family protein [Pedobacter hiemivivus]|uniref:DoxX family protein n=1 Tax=Pedobacter hiemivivus TaxID=2530454 RepID=A0A4U1GGF3_9SPHI|nr:DoxX family protein [Pedobacter hiemivivus]TKC62090.1 DoxX family protein [Pedobacter hiemivivus]